MGSLTGTTKVFEKKKQKISEPEHPLVTAVVVAAGSSTRMGIPKQLIPLRGIPVIGHSLMALDAVPLIDEIVVVAREEDILSIYDICKSWNLRKVTKIVKGGDTRQQSVKAGVQAAQEETAYFAIHDGARPLVLPTTITAVIEAAFRCGAATAAVRVKDTIKEADEKGFITNTPDRRFLWSVQTPQVFERQLYLEALTQASALGLDFTDDCQLIERLGHPVHLVESDYANIKITTPEDLYFAEGLLRKKEENP